MGSFGSPFGFIIMIISKRKKFLISFVSLLSIFSLLYIFPASAASYTFSISSSRPQIDNSSGYVEFDSNIGGLVFYFTYVNVPDLLPDDLDMMFAFGFENSTITIACNLDTHYTDSSGSKHDVSFYGYYVQETGYVGTFSTNTGVFNRSYPGIKEIYAINGYNCSVNSVGAWRNSLIVSYGNENLVNQKLDSILNALKQQAGSDYNPSQPDPGVTSGIGSVESGESSIISGAEGNYNSQITSGNNTVLSFFKSAGNSLSFVQTMFMNLVSDKIYLLVIASIMLAILPVLINAAGGFRK